MKKFFLFIGLVILGLSAISQDMKFTKGDVTPGRFQTGKDFENFITGKIKITDASGVEYSFVKAEFNMKNKAGEETIFTVETVWSPQEKMAEILKQGRDGATYTFNKIVVKDNSGKEITLSQVIFSYDPSRKQF